MKTIVKKLQYFLVAAMVCALILPVTTIAANTSTVIASGSCGEDVSWQLTTSQDGLTLTIDGAGAMKNYIQYEYIDLDTNYPLADWDQYKDQITEVIIGDGITHIGGAAFYQEYNIRSVTIPESVESIGDYAFFGCYALTDITLPAGLKEVGYYAFSQAGLRELELPASLQRLNKFSFEACENLSEIRFHEGLSVIGTAAFSSCTSLEEVYLPDGLKAIDPDAFSYCSSLTKIVIPESVTDIGNNNKRSIFSFSKYVTICGTLESAAYDYAMKRDIPFINIDELTIPVQDLHFAQPSISLANMDSYQLQLKNNDSIDNSEIVWTSNRPQVASVDENGVVTANKYGKARIKATLKDDDRIYDECVVQTLFSDVANANEYYYKPVYWAAKNKIAGGIAGGVAFGPDNRCTRKQLAIFLWRMAGQPEEAGSLPFTDVTASLDSTEYKAILWAYNNKIIGGYADGTFKPSATVTRKQATIMLYRFAGRPKTDIAFNFSDVSGSLDSDYLRAVAWGEQNRIVNGSNGMFKPQNSCSRKQIVTFLYRLDKYFQAQ